MISRYFILLTLLSTSLAFGDLSKDAQSIQKASKFLTPKVLMKMFKGENLDKAYALAQDEDFEPGEPVLLTSAMQKFLSASVETWYDKFSKYPEFQKLKFIPERSKTERMELLQIWRYEFLSRMMEALRYRNSLKPTTKFFVSSITQYDSNVNKYPEYAAPGLPGISSGKDDFQQLFLVHADWEPLVNCKKFPKDLSFSQSFNLITVSQSAHKENEIMILDTEPKITKTFDSYFRTLSLAYRFQHFGYSGNPDSRQTHALFQDHRVKLAMKTKRVPFILDNIFKTVQSGWYISLSDKKHYNDTNKLRNADDMRIGLQSNFNYYVGKKVNRFNTVLEYADYQVDQSSTTEYKYLRAKATHYHSHQFSGFDKAIKFSEEIGYRIKSWDDYDGARNNRDEDSYYFKLKAATNLNKNSEVSLFVKHLRRERDEQNNGTEDADQTIIGLGLNWRTH